MTLKVNAAKYYPALDGLRAVSVLLVFTSHYSDGKIPILYNWGWVGVDFFFVLSGFLITGIVYDSRDRVHSLRDFYMRRMLRIFPLYYAVWVGLLLVGLWSRWSWNWEWLLWPLHLGNLARFVFFRPDNLFHLDQLQATAHTRVLPAVNMGHFWSLCIEEQFYLFWPFIVLRIASRRALLRLCVGIVTVLPVLRVLLLLVLPAALLNSEFMARFTPTRVDALVWGALLSLLMRGPERAWLHRHGRPLTVGALALASAGIGFYCWRSKTHFANLSDPFLSTVGLTLCDLVGFVLIMELIRDGSRFAVPFRWSVLRRLGAVSYGFYIFHDLPHAVYHFVGHRLWPGHTGLLTALIAFSATLILSFLSYRFYEAPFLRLKRYFASQTHIAPSS